MGAGVYSGIKRKNQQLKDVVMTDICPFSLGVDCHDVNDDIVMSFIIDRNSMLPCSQIKSYYAIHDYQTEVNFRIYQGESIIPENNIFLGSLSIACPPTNRNAFIATCRMTYDINGILVIDVTNKDGVTVSKTLVGNNVRLTEKEIETIKARLDNLRFSDDVDEESQLLISRAERVIEETISYERDFLMNALGVFKLTMNKGNTVEKRNAKEGFKNLLDQLEGLSQE